MPTVWRREAASGWGGLQQPMSEGKVEVSACA